ncbi:MAG: peptidyl-prolyl cis-trans isomerase [Bacteroides sp.]|nr:peptidyl-prolyl cis-trans isomerase [Bacteroides sp.]
MQALKHLGLLVVACGSLVACRPTEAHRGEQPLVEVGAFAVYPSEVKAALPLGLRGADSAAFVAEFLRGKVEDYLLYEKAASNLSDRASIDRRVEEYRRMLVLHGYTEELARQRNLDLPTEEEVQSHYEAHRDRFVLEHPLCKGIFLKLPLTAPQLAEVRRWMASTKTEELDKLEKYSLRHVVEYDYFRDRWQSAADLLQRLPGAHAEQLARLAQERRMELRDSAYCYLLHLTEYLGAGSLMPYDLARQEVAQWLQNERRKDFVRTVKDELYQKALDNEQIKYHLEKTDK